MLLRSPASNWILQTRISTGTFNMDSGRHDENDILLSALSLALEDEGSPAIMDDKPYPLQDVESLPDLTPNLDTFPSWSNKSSIPPASKLSVVKNKFSRMIHHFWMIEVISSLISFLCLGLIVLVFLAYDGKKQETQGIYSGLPTTTVNILITLMRTAMVLPVGTALAQLQWSWFTTEQQLVDMETFADATRGPFGSMVLLSKMTQRRFWHFASIGAILTVLSLPLESVVIHGMSVPMKGDPLPDKDVDQNYIGVWRTNRYEWSLPFSHDTSLANRVPPPSMVAAIEQGIAQAVSYGDWENATARMLSPRCTTGFCEYPRYQSLGVTHFCDDLSSHVVTTDRQHSLPANDGLESQLTLGLGDGLINTTVSFLYPDSTWFQHHAQIGPLIANIFILTNLLNETMAVECALFWTVVDYTSKTSNGNWKEYPKTQWTTTNESSVLHAAIHPEEDQDIIMNFDDDDCWVNGTQIPTSQQTSNATLKEECTYFITAPAQQGLQNWLKSPTHGFIGSLSPNLTPSNTFVTVLATLFQEITEAWPTRTNKTLTPSGFLVHSLSIYLFFPFNAILSASVRTLPRGSLFGRHTWGQLSAGVMYDSFRFRVLWPIIDRKTIVQQFNPQLTASHPYSPLQVGNGNFAFGVDVTGLQTFLPHNSLSSWGWHNDSLPTTAAANQTSMKESPALELWTHNRFVQYEELGDQQAEKESAQWAIANPHRINLGRIGLWFGNSNETVEEDMLAERKQRLDLWEGVIESSFSLRGEMVGVSTVVDPERDTVAVEIKSRLLGNGDLGVFLDFPFASGKNKFDAPFVGVWNETGRHETVLEGGSNRKENAVTIKHVLDSTVYFVDVRWEGSAGIEREREGTHRFILKPGIKEEEGGIFKFTVTFAEKSAKEKTPRTGEVQQKARQWWNEYWENGAFISLPTTTNSSARELQRRIILSQYLLAVNGAGKDPAQESGLVNNGWYGKFHLEMVFWHLSHWMLWNKWSLYDRSIGIYERFLPSSIARATKQGYQGARLGKMCDPSGRSAPGEINNLLIWQQPHPMYFAEMEYRKFPTEKTLRKWDAVLTAVADFMASYAWLNNATQIYDLGPPLHIVSENTKPNITLNPPFELAYWRFGLSVAESWKTRQNKPIPAKWPTVRKNLAPFPTKNTLYILHQAAKNPWTTKKLTQDHPALLGLNGWLPPDPRLNMSIFTATVEKVYETWNFTKSKRCNPDPDAP
ncbi:hypothetical protein EG328_008134 [Venturia inaequalis]|uniref:Uncharacterized protein n=1 Tax=Venturia inaequalis TaxID=5025 RepID=A0A8H3VBY3_VENIN|nr:hypothetical protein EG328_008134 [Venturia inaequalis]